MNQQTVHLAVYDTLADWEYGHAVAAINAPTYQRDPGSHVVRTVATSTEPVTTMGGLRIQPDSTFAELEPADSAMLILPGAEQFDAGGNADAIEAARGFVAAGTPVAAICGAVFGLASAGLLDDRRHTGAAAEHLAASGYAGGERYRDEDVVADGGVITAGPTEPIPFARAILAELEVFEPQVLDAWFGLYDTGEPRYFFELMQATGAAA